MDEAAVIGVIGPSPVGRAIMEGSELLLRTIVEIRTDQIAAGAGGCSAKAVDLSRQTRLNRENSLAQRLAFDEIVWQLIERAIEVVVYAGVSLEYADQDLPFQSIVLIEREAGSLTDDDAAGLPGANEPVGNRDRFVEDIMKKF